MKIHFSVLYYFIVFVDYNMYKSIEDIDEDNPSISNVMVDNNSNNCNNCNNEDNTNPYYENAELDILNKIYNRYKNIYPNYINDEHGKYVYGSSGDWIIVFEKLPDSVVNENRANVLFPKFAEYVADKLLVKFIFNRNDPRETTTNYISILECCMVVTYKVGDVIKQSDFRLSYYKSVARAYFKEVMYDGYSGFYIDWHDNGFITEKGHYLYGKKVGVWKYGSMVKKTPDPHSSDFTMIEYEDGEVVKKQHMLSIYGDYQMVKWIAPNENLEKLTLFQQVLSRLYGAAIYVDSYLPSFITKYWK